MKPLLSIIFFLSIFNGINAQSYTYETASNDSLKFTIAYSLFLDYQHKKQYPKAMEYWEKCIILDVPKSQAFYYRGKRALRKMIEVESSSKKSKELTNRLFEIWEMQENDIGLSDKDKIRLDRDKELLRN